jgi:leucyl-tRNA synthetase
VNDLYVFSERTTIGAPARRAEDDETAPAPSERRETVAVVREALEALIRLLAPFAPHTAEEMWERLGYRDTLTTVSWPAYDAAVARAEEIVVPVQVNGKVRGRLTVSADISEQEMEQMALADSAIAPFISGKTLKKVVVAKGRLVSLVVQ